MSWRRRNKGGVGYYATILVIVTVVGILGIDWFSHGVLRTRARDMVAMVWSGVAQVEHVAKTSGVLQSKSSLASENEMLKQELKQLLTLQLQNDVLRSENAALRGLLVTDERAPLGGAVRVLSRPTASPYSTFVIERTDRMAIGDHVLIAPDILIGAVVEMGTYTALVELYTAPGTTHDVFVGEHALTYHGLGSGNGKVDAPRTLAITEKETVIDAMTGFAVGAVSRIESSPEDALQTLRIGPPTNLRSLRFVYIVPVGTSL